MEIGFNRELLIVEVETSCSHLHYTHNWTSTENQNMIAFADIFDIFIHFIILI